MQQKRQFLKVCVCLLTHKYNHNSQILNSLLSKNNISLASYDIFLKGVRDSKQNDDLKTITVIMKEQLKLRELISVGQHMQTECTSCHLYQHKNLV